MVAPLYTTASGLLFHAGKILVITVGLPARGKTHISRALERYLRWAGVKTQVISLGDYRRKTIGGAQKLPPDYFTLGSYSDRWDNTLSVSVCCHSVRREEPRDGSAEGAGADGLRADDLGVLQWRRPGGNIRRQ